MEVPSATASLIIASISPGCACCTTASCGPFGEKHILQPAGRHRGREFRRTRLVATVGVRHDESRPVAERRADLQAGTHAVAFPQLRGRLDPRRRVASDPSPDAAARPHRTRGRDGGIEEKLDELQLADPQFASHRLLELPVGLAHAAHDRFDRRLHTDVRRRVVADEQAGESEFPGLAVGGCARPQSRSRLSSRYRTTPARTASVTWWADNLPHSPRPTITAPLPVPRRTSSSVLALSTTALVPISLAYAPSRSRWASAPSTSDWSIWASAPEIASPM